MENWFKFTAFNSQAVYGYGTLEEAEKYEDRLNEGKETGHYSAETLNAVEVADLKLESGDEGFNLGDALEDYE